MEACLIANITWFGRSPSGYFCLSLEKANNPDCSIFSYWYPDITCLHLQLHHFGKFVINQNRTQYFYVTQPDPNNLNNVSKILLSSYLNLFDIKLSCYILWLWLCAMTQIFLPRCKSCSYIFYQNADCYDETNYSIIHPLC